MLGSKPIVRDKCARSRPRGDVPDKVTECFGTSQVKPSGVQMEDRFVRPGMRRMNPEPRNAANRVGFEAHVIAWQNSLHHGIEWLAFFDAPRFAFHGARHSSRRGSDARIFRVKRMGYYEIPQRPFSCRTLHGQPFPI